MDRERRRLRRTAARRAGHWSPLGQLLVRREASLSDGSWPAWSPDGSEIAFVSVQGAGQRVFHPRRPGGWLGPTPSSARSAVYPDWTPDGRLIYTKGQRDGPRRIFISDGGTERQLIPDATAPARPSYRDSQAVWLR